MKIRAGVLTASDKRSAGAAEDLSGRAIREVLEPREVTIEAYQVIPDEQPQIAARLREWADERRLDLILTTGGTGLAPRDVTPEATLAVIDREVPGLAEAMRAASLAKTPHAMLSRAVAGIRGRTLIVNLPGSPKAVRECLEVLLPVLPHAVETLRGDVGEHGP
jgi:molybdopterin adenylyltransferase